MSSRTLLESIENLEQEVNKFSQIAENYEELSNLIEEIPNILKFEQLITYHKKKYEELKEIVKKNKILAKSVQYKLKNMPISSKTLKVNENDGTDGKIFMINLKKLQIYMKKECCEAVKHLDDVFKAEFNKIESLITESKKETLDLSGSEKIIQDINNFSRIIDSSTVKSIQTLESRCISIMNQKLSEYENCVQYELSSLKSQINI